MIQYVEIVIASDVKQDGRNCHYFSCPVSCSGISAVQQEAARKSLKIRAGIIPAGEIRG
ncbi:hypothetical protein CLOHYLEM_04057 [[Clostridium] hylemonae DSM 15053]|uniref:Uncharacterized protein n=1 Tax=[Clostridium] hylemonae DSM 15053 TaxID=553973 RepID=C0BW28_9FIRM|nr:hypothetical protein CLOHYLEM_04057 [[Clostridium] hylemonae DSM 15053]